MLNKSVVASRLAIRTFIAVALCCGLATPGYCQRYTSLVTPSGHKYKVIATGLETRADGKSIMLKYLSEASELQPDAMTNEVEDIWDLLKLDAERTGASTALVFAYRANNLEKPAKVFSLKAVNGVWSCATAPQVTTGSPARVAYRQAYQCFLAGKSEQALQLYNRSIALDPNYAQAYIDRAGVYLTLGKINESIADSTTALKLNPSSALAYCNRGIAYTKLNNPVFAVQDFNQSLKLNPRVPLTFEKRAEALVQLGRYENAATDLSFAIKMHRKPNPRLFALRATILRKLADADEIKASALNLVSKPVAVR